MTDLKIVSEPSGDVNTSQWYESAGSFAWRSGCSAWLRSGGSARSSTLIGGDRALEGGCWPAPLGPTHLFRVPHAPVFPWSSREPYARQAAGGRSGVVAEVKDDV